MEEQLKNTLIDNYNIILANISANNIKIATHGFVSNNCNSLVFSILIHCMENIEIFSNTQLTNISNFINKLSYA